MRHSFARTLPPCKGLGKQRAPYERPLNVAKNNTRYTLCAQGAGQVEKHGMEGKQDSMNRRAAHRRRISGAWPGRTGWRARRRPA